MNAVNAVQLFILVWTFYAVCQADDGFIVSCDDVTGSVGEEATFTCRVSLQLTEFCIKTYKFQYPEIYNDSEVCKEEPPVNRCEQRNSFTCRYTPTTAMTEQFRFLLQSVCGWKTTEFTVNITGPATPEIVTGTPGPTTLEIVTEVLGKEGTSLPDTEGLGSHFSAIAAVVGCLILLLLIIIIRNKKQNYNKSYGFQKRMFLDLRHDEDSCDHPEDVIIDSA